MCYVLRDEAAEETWSVFDHPTIRIYKKQLNSNVKAQMSNQIQNSKLKNHQTINYSLTTNHYSLLLADTPQKWQQGLMDVHSKEEIQADGMLFNFPESSKRIFWNKNTLVDLDLYWINKGKVLGQSYLPSITKTKNIITVQSPEKVDQVIEIIK